MRAESIQLVGVGCSDETFAMFDGDFFCAPVRIEPALVKMAPLDSIETIDLFNQTRADRPAQNIKRVRRESEQRSTAFRAQFSQIVEVVETRDFIRCDVEKDNVGALQTNFGRGNEENSHFSGIGENFSAIEDSIVQRDGEHPEAQHASAFEQLMRGVIDFVFRIVEGVNMEIELDPIFTLRRIFFQSHRIR